MNNDEHISTFSKVIHPQIVLPWHHGKYKRSLISVELTCWLSMLQQCHCLCWIRKVHGSLWKKNHLYRWETCFNSFRFEAIFVPVRFSFMYFSRSYANLRNRRQGCCFFFSGSHQLTELRPNGDLIKHPKVWKQNAIRWLRFNQKCK